MSVLTIPTNHTQAANCIRVFLSQRKRLASLPKPDFLSGWFALAFFAPGLHPDEFDNPEGGWPEGWRVFAAEAFRRADLGELEDDELYPAEAAHAALALRRSA